MQNNTPLTCPAHPSRSARVPGADLLRIVTMLMILTSHFFVHGSVLGRLTPKNPNFYISWVIEGCCYVMVNCFALITGYFQSRSKFKLKKLMLLWGQIVAISGGAYLVLALSGKLSFNISAFLSAATPVTGQKYWFATAYVVLYAISPLLNFVIERMDRRQLTVCTAALLGIFVVFRNFFYWTDFENLHGGYSWASLAVLYVTGAYLRKYPPKIKYPLLWYGGLSLITAASRIILTILWYRFQFDSVYLKALMQYNSVTVVAASVCLFLFFVNLKIKSRAILRLIGFFSPATFGVYLIHEQGQVKDIIWKLIRPTRFMYSPRLYAHLVITILALFISCALIDRLRNLLSRGLCIPKLFGYMADKLEGGAKRIFDKVYRE